MSVRSIGMQFDSTYIFIVINKMIDSYIDIVRH